MNEPPSDFEWLQQFVRAGDQNAFRDLVRRHIDLVFATALRKAGEAPGAEEISQNVFSALARKAWRFAPDDSLPAWLHKTALLESKAWIRGELRRRQREQTAAELGTTMKTPDDQTALNALVPLLDDALLALREKDRAALLLRFYEKNSLKAVGQTLGVSEDAAHKRVQNALEKVSDFFRRRGYKTATAAVAAAVLQQSSVTVSTATAAGVAGAALQVAPPVLAGAAAWITRLATMTKMQTAVLCGLVTVLPVVWKWHQHRQASELLTLAESRLVAAQHDFLILQNEVRQLRNRSDKADADLVQQAQAVTHRDDQSRQFEAWKQHIRAELLAADYRWPDDSPFVRIPKSVLPELDVYHAINPPGTIRPEARELLGLSPQERQQIEATLQKYFSALDDLMKSNFYETNHPSIVSIPADALDSRVFGLPALGDAVKQQAEALQTSLQNELGEERWPLVARQLESTGTDTMRRILNLDAGEKGQELAVWISEINGHLRAGYGWGEQGEACSSSGLDLRFFLEGSTLPGGGTIQDYMNVRQFPAVLSEAAMAWIRQQAQTRLSGKGDL